MIYSNVRKSKSRATAVDLGLDENTQGAGRIDIASALGIEPPRPQSKVVNNANTDLTTNLIIKIQKEESSDNWIDTQTPINQQVTIPANGLIKLDKIFNAENVVINDVGKSRVVAEFKDGNNEIIKTLDGELRAEWEFEVK